MPYNGSGAFSPPGADYPAVANTLIESTKRNNVDADFATGLSTAICKDGQTTVTANIPFAGFKLTGVGAATARTDAAQYAQVQNSSPQLIGTIAGTNTITGVLTPTLTAYTAGQKFRFVPANTNTGATTINVDGLGAKNIYFGNAACIGGEIRQNVPCEIMYDGTQFQITGPFVGGTVNGVVKFNNGGVITGTLGSHATFSSSSVLEVVSTTDSLLTIGRTGNVGAVRENALLTFQTIDGANTVKGMSLSQRTPNTSVTTGYAVVQMNACGSNGATWTDHSNQYWFGDGTSTFNAANDTDRPTGNCIVKIVGNGSGALQITNGGSNALAVTGDASILGALAVSSGALSVTKATAGASVDLATFRDTDNTNTTSGRINVGNDASASASTWTVYSSTHATKPALVEFWNQSNAALSLGANGAEVLRLFATKGVGLVDGITAPAAVSGYAQLFVDTADGDLKVIFGDGTTKTIVADT